MPDPTPAPIPDPIPYLQAVEIAHTRLSATLKHRMVQILKGPNARIDPIIFGLLWDSNMHREGRPKAFADWFMQSEVDWNPAPEPLAAGGVYAVTTELVTPEQTKFTWWEKFQIEAAVPKVDDFLDSAILKMARKPGDDVEDPLRAALVDGEINFVTAADFKLAYDWVIDTGHGISSQATS